MSSKFNEVIHSVRSSDVRLSDYCEADALQVLLQAANNMLSYTNDMYALDPDYPDYSQFTINIGGQSVALLLGGPQFQGLCEMIKCIAEDNGYDVDFETCTVSE